MAADETLSLILRVLGVSQAARETERAAATVAELGAAAQAAQGGLRAFDQTAAHIGASLKDLGSARIAIDTSGITTAGQAITALSAGVAAVPPLDLHADTSSLVAAAQAATGVGTAGEQAGAVLGAGIAAGATQAEQELLDLQAQIQATLAESRRLADAGKAAAGGPGAASGLVGAFRIAGQVTGAFAALGVAVYGVQKAFGMLTAPIRAVVTEAGAAEQAVRALDVALASTGQFSTTLSAQLQAEASAHQAVTQATDEEVLSAQALLAQVGRLGGGDLTRATAAALDLAAVLGTDLQSAALQLSKAAEGNVESLARLGIVIDDSIPRGERYAAVLTKIERNFGGAAADQARTLQGSIRQLGAAWSDLSEEMGKPFVLPATDAFRGLADLVRGLRDQIAEPVVTARDAVDGLADALLRLKPPSGLAEVNQLVRQFENVLLPTIKLAFEKGNADEIRVVLEEIDRQILRIQASGSSIDFGPVIGQLERLRALGAEALVLRVGADTTNLEGKLAELDSKIRPKTLDVAIRGDTRALDAALRSFEGRKVAVELQPSFKDLRVAVDEELAKQQAASVPVMVDLSRSDLANQLGAMTRDVAGALKLQATLEVEVPKADAKSLQEFSAVLTEGFVEASRQGTEAGDRLAAMLASVIARFQELRGERTSIVVEAPALKPLQDVLENVREIRAEASREMPTLDLKVVPPADVATALVRIEAGFIALRRTAGVTSEQLKSAFDGFRSSAQEAAKAVPELAGILNAAVARIGAGVGVTIPIRFSAEEAARDATAIAEQAVAVLREVSTDPIRIADAAALAANARDVQQAAEALRAAVAAGTTGATELDKLSAAYESVRVKAAEARTEAGRLGPEAVAGLDAAAAALRGAIDERTKTLAVREETRTLDIAVKVLDLPAAEAALERIKTEAAGSTDYEVRVLVRGAEEAVKALRSQQLRDGVTVPIRTLLDQDQAQRASFELDRLVRDLKARGEFTIEAKIETDQLRRAIGETSHFTREAGQNASRELKSALGDIGLDGVTDAIAVVGEAAVGRVRDVGEAVGAVIDAAVSGAIKALARFAAQKFFSSLAGLLPGGGVIATVVGGWQPVTTGGGVASKGTGPEPQARPLPPVPVEATVRTAVRLEPEITVRPDLRVEVPALAPLALEVALAVPEAIHLPAPLATVERLGALTIPAPELRQTPGATLTVIPSFEAGVAAPLRVLPAFEPGAALPVAVTGPTFVPGAAASLPVAAPVFVAGEGGPLPVPGPTFVAGQAAPLEVPGPQFRDGAVAPTPVEAPQFVAGRAAPVPVDGPTFVAGPAESVAVPGPRFLVPEIPQVVATAPPTLAPVHLAAPEATVEPLAPVRVETRSERPSVTIEPQITVLPSVRVFAPRPAPVAVIAAFTPPEAVPLPAPVTRIEPLRPQTLAAPALRIAASIAALAVTPVFDARPAAAVSVAPVFVAGEGRPVAVAAPTYVVGQAAPVETAPPRFVVGASPADVPVAAPTFVPRQAAPVGTPAPRFVVEANRPVVPVEGPTYVPGDAAPVRTAAPRFTVDTSPGLVRVPGPRYTPGEARPVATAGPTFRVGAAAPVETVGPRFILAGERAVLAVDGPRFRLVERLESLEVTPAFVPRTAAPIGVTPSFVSGEARPLQVTPTFIASEAPSVPVRPAFLSREAGPVLVEGPRFITRTAPTTLEVEGPRFTAQKLPAPEVTVERLRPVSLVAQVGVTARAPRAVDLGPVTIEPLDRQRIPAPDVSIERPAPLSVVATTRLAAAPAPIPVPAPRFTAGRVATELAVAPPRFVTRGTVPPPALAVGAFRPVVMPAPPIRVADERRALTVHQQVAVDVEAPDRVALPLEVAIGTPETVDVPAPATRVRPFAPVDLDAPPVRLEGAGPRALPVAAPRFAVTGGAAAVPVPSPRFISRETPSTVLVPTPRLGFRSDPIAPALRTPALGPLTVSGLRVHLDDDRPTALVRPRLAVVPEKAAPTRVPAPTFEAGRSRTLTVSPDLELGARAGALSVPAPRVGFTGTPTRELLAAFPRTRLGATPTLAVPYPRAEIGEPTRTILQAPEIGFAAPAEVEPISIAVPIIVPEPERRGARTVGRPDPIAVPVPRIGLAAGGPRELQAAFPRTRLGPAPTMLLPYPRAVIGERALERLDAPRISFAAPDAVDPINIAIPVIVPEQETIRRRVGPVPSKAVQEDSATDPRRTRALTAPAFDPAGLTASFRQVARAVDLGAARRGLGAAAALGPRDIQPGVPQTAAFLRGQLEQASRSLRRPEREIEPGSELLSRFAPRGQLGSTTILNVDTPDPMAFEQSYRRGPLGRAVRKANKWRT